MLGNLTLNKACAVQTLTLGPKVTSSEGALLANELSTTGVVLVSAPDVLPEAVVQQALERCAALMRTSAGSKVLGKVKKAPTLVKNEKKKMQGDYKESVMLEWPDAEQDAELRYFWEALEAVKLRVLCALEQYLEMDGLVKSHATALGNDDLRLLRYPPVSEEVAGKIEADGNRCYAHVDYGTITLLVADGPGLEVQIPDTEEWVPVPHHDVPKVVVNVGKEFADEMTHGSLRAAMHRVPGPVSVGTRLSASALTAERHAIALFVQQERYYRGPNKKAPPTNHTLDKYKRKSFSPQSLGAGSSTQYPNPGKP